MIEKYRLTLYCDVTRRQLINQYSEWELIDWSSDRLTKVLATTSTIGENSMVLACLFSKI